MCACIHKNLNEKRAELHAYKNIHTQQKHIHVLPYQFLPG